MTIPAVMSTMLNLLYPHKAESNGMIVRVSVNYLAGQSDPRRDRWCWAYQIRIENHRDEAVRLLTRHWKITDGRGALTHVDGAGVVGEQPLIRPGGSHDYVSGCPLSTSAGFMEGQYLMETDEKRFYIDIPGFELVAGEVEP